MKNKNLPIITHRICESFFLSPTITLQHLSNTIGKLAEYRHDLSAPIQNIRIAQIRQHIDTSIIFTCRPGKHITKQDQKEAYIAALNAKYDYIDLDFEADIDLIKNIEPGIDLQKQLILSVHYFDGMPADKALSALIAQMERIPSALLKIAVSISTVADLKRLQTWQSQWQHIMFVGMGKYALEYRAWSLVNTATPFTYAALNADTLTVKDQPISSTLQQTAYHLLGTQHIVAAVIGRSVQHSQSPVLFQHFAQEHKIKHAFYHKKDVKHPREIATVLQQYTAFNITAPYKQSVMAFLDKISPAAQAIGAVNTAYLRHGVWHGHNTDYIGIQESIAPYLSNIQKALVIGAGGAAKAAVYALQLKGIDTHIINRNADKATALAHKFSAKAITSIRDINHYQLIINTTPELQPPIANNLGAFQGVALDAIYPVSVVAPYLNNTTATLVRGEVWLAAQAQAAFQLFTS